LRLISVIVLILLLPCFGKAQEWTFIKSVKLEAPIVSSSMDAQYFLYLADQSGTLGKYDSLGNLLEIYSDMGNMPITTIEAWNRLKIFIYTSSNQQFLFLDRFNTTPVKYELRDFDNSLVSLCTPGVDNSLWVLNTDYNELRKYDLQTRRLISSNPQNQVLAEASYMRAYKNQLIISTPQSGLYFYDQFGNYQMQSQELGAISFQIVKDEIQFIRDGEILKLNRFTGKTIDIAAVPETNCIAFYQLGNRYIFIKKNELLIYKKTL
jgi:hypothetical protein